MKRSKDISGYAKREDEYEFRHALLSSGVFIHDWKEGLNSKLGVRYSLTEKGRNNVSVNPELVDLGFKVDKATITRNPLSHINVLNSRALPKQFQRKYTVDTLLGRWCPHSVWDVVEDVTENDAEFDAFYTSFLAATEEPELDGAYSAESLRSDRLLQMGLVTPDEGRLERWRARIESLRGNKEKLVRIFNRLEAFDMPYDYQSRTELQDLWDSLLDSISLKRNKSFAARKIEDAESAGDLELLTLSEEEDEKLRRELV